MIGINTGSHRLHRAFTCTLMLVCFAMLLGCSKEQTPNDVLVYSAIPAEAQTTYRFAIHPLYNPQRLFQAYQPLIDKLNQHTQGWRFELEASEDYQDYERKFRERLPDVLLPNPWHTIEANKNGYTVIAQAGDPSDFRGLLIVRKDSSIRTFSNLKGKTVSYPSYTALAACLLPQWFLHTNNIDVTKDIKNIYVGSQESSIMNVFLGTSDVGVTWPPPWRLFKLSYPEKAAQLQVLWETPSMINNSVMVRDDLPSAVITELKNVLMSLNQTKEGNSILEAMSTAAFTPASDMDYEVVKDFVTQFERNIRPVELHQ